MDKLVLHIVFLLTLFIARGQENLVPNGSFEEYNWCPYQTFSTDGFYINASKYWTMPTLGTSDYFNACSTQYDPFLQTFLFSVPENYYGNQEAHTGNAYGAFVFGQVSVGSATYSEYIQVKLNEQLKAGKFYEIRFFIHNPRSAYCINSVGALFTPNELNLNTDEVINLQPQVSSNPQIFFCDTNSWQEVKGSFQAMGNENYLTIGTFQKLPQLKVTDYTGTPVSEPFGSYLYIDDVSVVETELQLANIFTPNGDGINDTYFLDLKALGATKAEIFNRWGNMMVQDESLLNWDGTFDGQQCSEGVYFVRIQFENNTINGFIHLMR